MANVRRLCPVCGAANPLERVHCIACGADVKSDLPVPARERLPVPWKEVRASLAVSAGVLALRAGLHLAQHLLERKAAQPTALRTQTASGDQPRRWRRRRREVVQTPQRGAQVRAWGRRTWASWSRGGARHLEVEEFYFQADDS